MAPFGFCCCCLLVVVFFVCSFLHSGGEREGEGQISKLKKCSLDHEENLPFNFSFATDISHCFSSVAYLLPISAFSYHLQATAKFNCWETVQNVLRSWFEQSSL